MVVDKSVIHDLPDWVEPIDNPKKAYKLARFFIANEKKAYTVGDLESETTAISNSTTDEGVLRSLVDLGILDERMNHYMLVDRGRAEFYAELIDEHGAVLFDSTPNDNFPENGYEEDFTGGGGPVE